MTSPSRFHAVILAGGEGKRLAPLTRKLYGAPVPKQFAAITGDRTLLEQTLDRVAPLFLPECTHVVAPRAHAATALMQLRTHPGVELLLQPGNRDTGPGMLLPLARVRAVDPRAIVAVFPSDHHVPRPAPLLQAVAHAIWGAERGMYALALLGIEPDRDESELGFVVAGEPLADGFERVRRFVEKPPADEARALVAAGAVWNSFVMVGGVEALWSLARRHLPRQAELFEAFMREGWRLDDEVALARLYQGMPEGNWSRDVLERAADLAVLRVAGSGWSDWGTPERVLESLEASAREELLSRLA